MSIFLKKKIGHCSPYGYVVYPSKGIEIEFSDDCSEAGHSGPDEIEAVEISEKEFDSWLQEREPGYYYHTYIYRLDGRPASFDEVITRYLGV